jgi:hypothetical protein
VVLNIEGLDDNLHIRMLPSNGALSILRAEAKHTRRWDSVAQI